VWVPDQNYPLFLKNENNIYAQNNKNQQDIPLPYCVRQTKKGKQKPVVIKILRSKPLIA